jgi:hypothetical protein
MTAVMTDVKGLKTADYSVAQMVLMRVELMAVS